jgi:ATP-dependent exoDNAse (exonuclease V) alpha subunit
MGWTVVFLFIIELLKLRLMVLTEHQDDVKKVGLILLEVHKRLLIKGSAGVGKTTLAQTLIPMLLKGKKISVSAPTHKALAVLRLKIDEHELIEFRTLQSILKLKRKINPKTGEIDFKPDFHPSYPPLKGMSCIIIDEASMVSANLLLWLEEYATLAGCKILFLGDDKQINPIKELDSPVFLAGYPTVELTEIIRQAKGSSIISLSRNLDLLDSNIDAVDENMNGYLFSNDREKVIESLAAVNGTDEIKYLAWTNKEVDAINRDVRKAIYTDPNKVEIGESLVFNAPYRDTHYTNGEIKVNTLEIKTISLKYLTRNTKVNVDVGEVDMKVYCINPEDLLVKTDRTLPPGVIVIHEDSEQDYKNIVNFMKQQAKAYQLKWVDFYNFQEKFADLNHNHALTVHKSQGSTFQKTIMNVKDIRKNRNKVEVERISYTGVTRASELLILYNT